MQKWSGMINMRCKNLWMNYEKKLKRNSMINLKWLHRSTSSKHHGEVCGGGRRWGATFLLKNFNPNQLQLFYLMCPYLLYLPKMHLIFVRVFFFLRRDCMKFWREQPSYNETSFSHYSKIRTVTDISDISFFFKNIIILSTMF